MSSDLLAVNRSTGLRHAKDHTLRPTPATLSNRKGRAHDPGVHLARALLRQLMFHLCDSARFALVVHSNHLPSELKLLASRGRRNILENGDLTLAIYNSARIELRDTRDLKPT
jgi:hypothetical protein